MLDTSQKRHFFLLALKMYDYDPHMDDNVQTISNHSSGIDFASMRLTVRQKGLYFCPDLNVKSFPSLG